MILKTNIKKLAAGLTAAAMLASLTACGEDTTWAATADGSQIKAGIFIYYLQEAYYQAQYKLTPDEEGNYPDVYTTDIEGKNGKAWIYDYATEQLQRYAALNSKADAYGIALTADELEALRISAESTWDYFTQYVGKDYYETRGVSQESYIDATAAEQLYTKLFEKIYGEGGEKAVSDADIKAHLDEDYAMINYIDIELKDGEGNLLKAEGKEERMAMAEEYVRRYNEGESFDVLNAEYTAFYNKLVADANPEGEAAADIDFDSLVGELGEGMVEATPAEAEDAESEEGTTAETAAEETSAPEENAEETETEAPAEEAAEETAAEETAAETEAPAEEAAPAEADPGFMSDDVNLSNGTFDAVSSNETVIEKDGSVPSEDVSKAVFGEMAKGEIKIIESADGEHIYVVLKEDILATDEYFNNAKSSLLYEMKKDEYDELIKEWENALSFEKNQKAFDRYDAKKLFGE